MAIIKKHPLLKKEAKAGRIMGINRVGVLGAGTMGEALLRSSPRQGFR
jgi:predicted homoserine dehydrogenase-like protein